MRGRLFGGLIVRVPMAHAPHLRSSSSADFQHMGKSHRSSRKRSRPHAPFRPLLPVFRVRPEYPSNMIEISSTDEAPAGPWWEVKDWTEHAAVATS